jgi:hypothetical protein
MPTGSVPPPIVKTFLLCKQAGIDEHKHLILVSPLASIIVKACPMTAMMAVYMRLTAIRADFEIALQLTNPDGTLGQRLILPSRTGHSDPAGSPIFCWMGQRFNFPMPGRYDIEVLFDGQEAYTDSLLVTLSSTPQTQPPENV